MDFLKKETSKKKLQIRGGAPFNQMDIDKGDLSTKRSGLRQITSFFGGAITSSITVSIRPI